MLVRKLEVVNRHMILCKKTILSHKTESLEMGVQRYKTRDSFLCTGTITGGAHAPMTGDDHAELVTGREDSD